MRLVRRLTHGSHSQTSEKNTPPDSLTSALSSSLIRNTHNPRRQEPSTHAGCATEPPARIAPTSSARDRDSRSCSFNPHPSPSDDHATRITNHPERVFVSAIPRIKIVHHSLDILPVARHDALRVRAWEFSRVSVCGAVDQIITPRTSAIPGASITGHSGHTSISRRERYPHPSLLQAHSSVPMTPSKGRT
jgi:hypothetical protein